MRPRSPIGVSLWECRLVGFDFFLYVKQNMTYLCGRETRCAKGVVISCISTRLTLMKFRSYHTYAHSWSINFSLTHFQETLLS
jgi:hypothetical protein